MERKIFKGNFYFSIMFKYLCKIRGHSLTKEELYVDGIILVVSAIISLLVIYLFDIHRSFYSLPISITYIFNSSGPYIVGSLIGTLVIFILFKITLFAFEKDIRKKI